MTFQSYVKMAQKHKDECHAELAKWFLQSDRVKRMVEDEGFATFLKKVQMFPGMYDLPGEDELSRQYKRRGAMGQEQATHWIKKCKAADIKPSIAGDIWSQGDKSILAILGYAIFNQDGKWDMEEIVLGVVRFNNKRHTGANIQADTEKALREVGIENMYDHVWRKVSDAGSNMKKGWRGFDGGNQTCADHKLERSVLKYMEEPEIAVMKRRRKALTNLSVRTVPAYVE